MNSYQLAHIWQAQHRNSQNVFLTLSMECHATNAMDRTYPRGLIRRESVVNEHQLYVSKVVMLSLDKM